MSREFVFMNFDLLMPLFLFLLPLGAIFLAKRAETKLKKTIESQEFGNKDSALFITMITLMFTVIFFIPDQTILVLFLFSYSSLLFTVSYVYSDLRPKRLQLYCGVFAVVGVLAAVAGLAGLLSSDLRLYGAVGFAVLAVCAVVSLVYAQWKADGKQKWYIAALSPALFVLLYLFFNQTPIWFPYLMDIYGMLFAILIIMYMAPMFNWKILFIFAVAITTLDIILVWGPGHLMVQAADTLTGMNLPVLVWLPNIPFMTSAEGYVWFHGLGLGDLFFTGVLSFQTLKRLGKKTTIVSMVAISISFGLNELVLMNENLAKLLPVAALPATLPILAGWLPVIAVKLYFDRKHKPKTEPTPPSLEPAAPQNLPPVQPQL
jgi:hypothetical protein